MESLFIIYIFILGTLVGSFINVVALRHNSGLSSSSGRSMCIHCGMPLKWYDLIPILSFFLLLGRCRYCKNAISWRYPCVEIFTGLLFVGIFLRQYYYWPLYSALPHGLLCSVAFFIYYAIVLSLLLIIALYDMKHKIIPNSFVYAFIILSAGKLAVFLYWVGLPLGVSDILNLFAPILLPLPFFMLWFLSRGRWIGFGDVKLMLGIGALLGFALGLSAIVLGFWIGAVCGLGLLMWSKVNQGNGTWKLTSEVPFGPFLIIGVLIIFFTHIDMFSITSLTALLHS